MAQLSALITCHDQEFHTHVARVLRTSGVTVAVVEERSGGGQLAPDVAVVDARGDSASGTLEVERLRHRWPEVAIITVAAAADPAVILGAMRAGANEFFDWPVGGSSDAMDDGIRSAVTRITQRLVKTRRAGESDSRMFSFFGAKGGAGTTTIAVNTATEVARVSKRPTVIVEFNPFLGEVGLFLGVRPRFTVMDAVENLHRLDSDFVKELVTKHKSGLDILAGSDHVDRPNLQDVGAIEELLRVIGRSYDFVIIDVGSLARPCAETAVFGSDSIFIVANPDVPSIRNTQRMVERLADVGANRDRIRILLNRTSAQHAVAPQQIERALKQPIDRAFPSDYGTVSEALNAGVPLSSSNHTELAGQFRKFAKQIASTDAAAEERAPERKRSFALGLF